MLHKKNLFVTALALLIILAAASLNSQVIVKLSQPPPNQWHVEDLWQLTLTNTSPDFYNVYLYGTVKEADAGVIFEATSASFVLEKNYSGPVNLGDLEPVDMEYNSDYEDIVQKTGTLPAGTYTICIVVIDSKTEKELGSDCIIQPILHLSPPQLISPASGAMVVDEFPVFTWMPPMPLPPGQEAFYDLKIVEILTGQSPFDAMQSNPAWFEEKGVTITSFRYPVGARAFEGGNEYAWQINAYDEEGFSLGESEIWEYSFTRVRGRVSPEEPDEVEFRVRFFQIGRYVMEVIHVDDPDLEHFSGTGNLKLDPFDITIPNIEFSELKLSLVFSPMIPMIPDEPPPPPPEDSWIVAEGIIEFDTDLMLPLSSEHYEVYLSATAIKLENHRGTGSMGPGPPRINQSVRISGSVWLHFPLAIYYGGLDYEIPQSYVKTASQWFVLSHINGINGNKQLLHEYSYSLRDPEGFEVKFLEDSQIMVYHNEVSISFSGDIKLPETVKDIDGNRVSIAFEGIDRFYYTEDLTISADIAFLNNTNIAFHPSDITVDFSETESPSGLTPEWKGVFFNEGELIFPIEIHTEIFGLRVDREERIPITDLNNFYVSSGGLNGSITQDGLGWAGSYRGFGGGINSFSVTLEDNTVSEGSIAGSIAFPFLNEDMNFALIITDEGLQEGSIEATSLGSRAINVGDDNTLTIDITRGILSYEAGVGKLVLDLNFTFDVSGIKTEPIPVNGFYVTSEGNIGIGSWVDLIHEVNASFHGFSLTLTRAGAGNEGELYWLGIHGSITFVDVLSSSGGTEFEAKIYLQKEPLHYDHTYLNSIALVFENEVVKFNGSVAWYEEDPIYGEGFQMDLSFELKKPSVAGIDGSLIIGHKEEEGTESYKYWFIEAGVTGLNIPVFAGVSIYGFTGRVYYHMRYNEESTSYIPDGTTLFGIYAGVPFGSSGEGDSKGKKYWGNTSLEVTVGEDGGGSSVALNGDVYILPEDGYNDTDAKVHGSAEVIVTDISFDANFDVEANILTLICGTGEIELHFEDSDWHLYLGTNEDPIDVEFFCKSSFSASAYLMFAQTGISFGAGFDVNTGRRTWSIFYAKAEGGFDVYAVIIYDSPISHFEGGANLYADVLFGFHYDLWILGEGDFDVLSASLNASLHFETPTPTIFCGKVSARGCIWRLCKTVKFKMKWQDGVFYMEGC